jgi:hypothetical protein
MCFSSILPSLLYFEFQVLRQRNEEKNYQQDCSLFLFFLCSTREMGEREREKRVSRWRRALARVCLM